MPSLAHRLQSLHETEQRKVPDAFAKMSLLELQNCTLDFGGKEHRGMKFIDIWNDDQLYVLWCAQHLVNSKKLPHQKFLYFIELMVGQAEDRGWKIPLKDVTGEALLMKAKPKASEGCESQQTGLPVNDAAGSADMRSLEARLSFLEIGMARVITYLNLPEHEKQ